MLWNPSCTPYSRGGIRSCSRRLRAPFLVRPRLDLLLARCYATEGAPIREGDKKSRLESLSGISNPPCGASLLQGHDSEILTVQVPAQPRFNEIGVQQLSDHVYAQIFPGKSRRPDPELVALSKEHLSRHDLLGKSQNAAEPVSFDFPALQGQTLDEHFYKLGMDSSEPYLSYAKSYTTATSPHIPRKWIRRSGWTKYGSDGSS